MTRAQGLRSSKRIPVKLSQEIIPEYCKENSPSILSQNSRRAAQAKKKTIDCKVNIWPKGSKRKPVKSSHDIICEDSKENSLSILSQSSRRAAQAKEKSDDCKANILPKVLREKPVNSNQDIVHEYCKETSPSIFSKNSSRTAQVKEMSEDCKENISPKVTKKKLVKSRQDITLGYCKENSLPTLSQNSRRAAQVKEMSEDCKENISPKVTQIKLVKSGQDITLGYCKENSLATLSQNSRRAAQPKENCDTLKKNSPKGLSNSSKLFPATTNQELYSPLRKSRRHPNVTGLIKTNQSERNVLNDNKNLLLSRNNIFHKIITVPEASSSFNNNCNDHENHIPVYKTACPLKTPKDELIPDKKEAVYEFEFDENEEPVIKKKRKKRTYIKKPKTGPKALTINNIKYSSTESLASLPEKPVCKKKNTFVKPKRNVKLCSSVATLNSSCVSVASVMSHPTLPLQENRCELSVLEETQSEQCPTLESTLLEAPVTRTPNVLQRTQSEQCPTLESTLLKAPTPNSVPATLTHSHHIHFSPNPRCYGSKSGQTPNPYNNDLHSQNTSSGATNVSSSSLDFLSSTPCKRFSQVVQHNSVFDVSPGPVRLSPGFSQHSSSALPADDNCFGFDEPEELEEPLVSPIKSGIDLQPRRILKCAPERYDCEKPKPSIQEVIALLKASIPKPDAKKDTTMFVTSPQTSQPVSPTVVDSDSPVFVKPARRSYERQRRVQYYNSDSEEEEEENIEEIKIDTTRAKEDKKCYKKANTSKTVRAPKVTKAKQKVAKEEEELERMVALMNAQFQEIEKVDLVVE